MRNHLRFVFQNITDRERQLEVFRKEKVKFKIDPKNPLVVWVRA